MASPKSYTCMFRSFILLIKPTDSPKRFTVRVSKRLSADPFKQALLIPAGSVIDIHSGTKKTPIVKHLFVRAFRPKLQYKGRFVASGELDAELC
jgi:hypothetical protein